MSIDHRLSRLAHALIHMSYHEGAATSDTIAKMLDTNPVVVRRMMAGLRKKNLVESQKGHGGGWLLTQKIENITLLDIYDALGDTNLISISIANQNAKCLVEQAVNEALEKSIKEAKALLYKRFSQINLADIATNFEIKMEKLPHTSGPAPCPPSQN